MSIFFFMVQPKQDKGYKVVPKNNEMFPFVSYSIVCNSVTETSITLPQQHICYNDNSKENIIQYKITSDKLMNCKRDIYNIQYRDFSSQTTLGDKIRCVRLQAGLTMEQLSQMIGVDRSTLIRYEHNIVSEDYCDTSVLLSIEDYCNVERYTLFSDYLLFYELGKLKQLRQQYNVTQKQLGLSLGINKNTIYRWEQKKCRPPRKTWQSTLDYFHGLSLQYSTNSSMI